MNNPILKALVFLLEQNTCYCDSYNPPPSELCKRCVVINELKQYDQEMQEELENENG